MDTWTARKRPWEEDSPIDSHFTRRDSTSAATVAAARQPSPLPQHAGYYSRDNQTLSQRRLPPLYTPSYSSTSAEPTTAISLHFNPQHQEPGQLDSSRPRSHSLFDVFQPPKRQRYDSYTGHTTPFPGSLELDRSPPPDGSDTHRPRFGTDPAPHPTGGLICCPSRCEAQACSNGRTLMRKLASELVLLDSKVRSITKQDHSPSLEPPEVDHLSTAETLQRALDILQWTNFSLDDHIAHPIPHSPEENSPQPDTTPTMRRGQHHLEEREEQSPPTRPYSGIQQAYPNFTHPVMALDENRRHPYGSGINSMANSPRHTPSSGSGYMPSQSPRQAPVPSRTTILPSPSSMNFPNVPNLPPMSPPTTSLQPSAQTAHLQDLQHQISVKTLAFQTLQREYDSLLQKLERQRTKCATLEKKFEVSDVEINSLTDEKEKLQAQVSSMETQVEELQQSRDEARRQLVANGAQYMRIMEMANRLQAQSADDKKRWEAEKLELEQRIKILEEAMLTGMEDMSTSLNQDSTCSPDSTPIPPLPQNPNPTITSSVSQTETIHVLRAEVSRLRSRTQILETALQTMKEESISIQEAAKQLVESGGKIERVAQGVTRRGG